MGVRVCGCEGVSEGRCERDTQCLLSTVLQVHVD